MKAWSTAVISEAPFQNHDHLQGRFRHKKPSHPHTLFQVYQVA